MKIEAAANCHQLFTATIQQVETGLDSSFIRAGFPLLTARGPEVRLQPPLSRPGHRSQETLEEESEGDPQNPNSPNPKNP